MADIRVSHSADTNYWEGNFHWNDVYSSQFLNATTQGEPKVRRKYEVTADQVGRPLTWTISNRENGTAVDLWLFSTHPDLMDKYTQEELDQIPSSATKRIKIEAFRIFTIQRRRASGN